MPYESAVPPLGVFVFSDAGNLKNCRALPVRVYTIGSSTWAAFGHLQMDDVEGQAVSSPRTF